MHTLSKYRYLFTYHNSPGKANELQNEILLKEKRCHEGLRQQPWPGYPINYISSSEEQVLSFNVGGDGVWFTLARVPFTVPAYIKNPI